MSIKWEILASTLLLFSVSYSTPSSQKKLPPRSELQRTLQTQLRDAIDVVQHAIYTASQKADHIGKAVKYNSDQLAQDLYELYEDHRTLTSYMDHIIHNDPIKRETLQARSDHVVRIKDKWNTYTLE